MKIQRTNSYNAYKNKNSFKGLIPLEQLKELAARKTPEAKKLLNSCVGFNAMYRGAENLNPDRITREMADKFQIYTDFANNPIVAACSALTANIFHKLGFVQPTNILVKDLRGTGYTKTLAFCTISPSNYELFRKFGEDFPIRSVIVNEAKNWDNLQKNMLRDKQENYLSTGHFLAPFIHEFIHSAHLDNLMKKHGNGTKIMRKMLKDFKNEDTIALIKKETSEYGSTKPVEMVAEEMTELIVESLSPKTLMPNEMIFKMQRAKEPFQMDVLIDACWSGDVKKIEQFRKKKNKFLEFIQRLNG